MVDVQSQSPAMPEWDPLRVEKMIRYQLEARDIRDERVLEAMRRVPRAAFVPPGEDPYFDGPIPIGEMDGEFERLAREARKLGEGEE